ncbi:MAG: bifunctional precorrin-2 dehydrogenase/sirohydrochlorin ferrochelatase [Desulfopila sp.]
MDLYPVNLNIAGRTCVIVGGGAVAMRKAGPLLDCGARVVLISPEAASPLEEMAESGKLQWHARKYRQGDLQGAFLAFAATDDPRVQQTVAAEAQREGVLCNSADAPEGCSFQVPARVRRGNFLLTVSTGGGSPALAAKLRRELAEQYGEEYKQFVDLLGAIRRRVVTDGQTSESHRILFEKLLQLNILPRIRQENWLVLQEELMEVLPKEVDVEELIQCLRGIDEKEHGSSG